MDYQGFEVSGLMMLQRIQKNNRSLQHASVQKARSRTFLDLNTNLQQVSGGWGNLRGKMQINQSITINDDVGFGIALAEESFKSKPTYKAWTWIWKTWMVLHLAEILLGTAEEGDLRKAWHQKREQKLALSALNFQSCNAETKEEIKEQGLVWLICAMWDPAFALYLSMSQTLTFCLTQNFVYQEPYS